MKLRLPHGLRKALLACLAVVSVHSLPMTVSSASLSAAVLAAISTQLQVAEAATLTTETTTDYTDRSSVGLDEDVTYSGWIFTMQLNESTQGENTDLENQPMYGGQNNEVFVKYYHWVPKGDQSGMMNALGDDGTDWSKNGRNTLAAGTGPDGTGGTGAGEQMWAYWSSSGGNVSNGHTLRLNGGTGKTYHITTGFSTSAYSLTFGGLIVEANQGNFIVGAAGTNPEKIVLKAADGCDFNALILSNFAFTNRDKGDGLAVSIESNANFRIGDGVTMDFGRWVKVGTGLTLTLTRTSATGGGSALVTMGHGADLAENAQIDVGNGVHLTVGEGITGAGSVILNDGSTLTAGTAGASGAASASSGSLSKLVVGNGTTGATLNVHGSWVLKELGVQSGSGKLTIGAGTAGDSLTFGGDTAAELVDGLTLVLSKGVTYGGELSIVVGDASETGQITLGDELTDLGSLIITVTGLTDKGMDWEGLSLFTNGSLTDAQCRMLEGHLVSDNTNGDLRLKVDTSGKVTLAEVPVLSWTDGGSNHTWVDSGGENVWTPQSGNAQAQAYESGADVIFAAIGGAAAQTVDVSGTVWARNITIGAADAAAQYTFNAATGGQAVVNVTGDITLLAAGTDETGSSATFNTSVNFSKAGGTNITGKGTVAFAGSGAASGSGLVVGEGITVEVSTSGNKNFGGIEVKEGGRFVVQDANHWDTNGNKVHGSGTIVLDTHSGWGHGVFDYFVSDATGGDTRTLHTLELADGTGITIGSDSRNARLANIQEIRVKSGAGLSVNALAMVSSSLTLYLAGDGAASLAGDGGAAGMDNAKLASEAAFAVYNYGWGSSGPGQHNNPSCAWNIVLEGDAKIAVGGVSNSGNGTASEVLTVNGSFDAKVYALTKVGIATLKLNNVQADTAGTDAAALQHAGAITVNGGTVEISGLADGAVSGIVATTVDLDNTDGTGTFKVSGSGKTYTVQKVVMGDGATNSESINNCNAHLTAGEGAMLVVEGDGGVALQMTNEKAGWIDGGGTVQLNGKVTGSGRIGIDGEGTTLVAGVQWDGGNTGYTGGLYLHGGTLQLGADVQVGWLGGTGEGYGGHITASDATERTITVTGSGGEAKGVEVGGHVKLKINDGITQNLIDLTGDGTLELGAGATSVVSGTSAIGSITNAGTLNLYKGTEQVTLEVTGKVKTEGAGIIVLGTGGTTSNDASTFTVNGNLELNGKSAVLGGSDSLYIQQGTVTVTGQISGTTKGEDGTLGRIRMGGGTLAAEGGGTWDGYLMLCNTSTLKLGTEGKACTLTVGGIDGSWNGVDGAKAQIQGNGELVLNVAAGTTANGNVSSGYGLMVVVSGDAHLTKAGEGTQVLSGLKTEGNAYVDVTGGTLQFATDADDVPDRTVIDVKDLRVTGASGVLDFARQNLQFVSGSNNLTLSNGGTLRSSYSGDGEASYQFGTLDLENGSDNKIVFSTGATGAQSFTFTELTGNGNMTLGEYSGTNENAEKSINLGNINGYTGTFSATLGANAELTISGSIVSGASEGKIDVGSGVGAVTLKGTALQKTGGTGTFTLSHLQLVNGQTLYMDYTGGELNITKLTLNPGVTLRYGVLAEDSRVHIKLSDLTDVFEGGGWTVGNDSIVLHTGDIDVDYTDGETKKLYLGVTTESIGEWTEEKLEGYFTFASESDEPVDLEWKQEDGQYKLYVVLISPAMMQHYWDVNWGEGSNETGPNNNRMSKSSAAWYGQNGASGKWQDVVGSDESASDFTGEYFAIAEQNVPNAFRNNNDYYLRLEKGSGKAGINADGTKLTILGGRLYNNSGAAGEYVLGEGNRIYLSLRAAETEHFHLLVGGSSFVQTHEGDTLRFEGDTHIQVQGGTVDHLVGGNHVSNSPAVFKGNTYISVYEGRPTDGTNGAEDPFGELTDGYRTSVRGGIVGGSTITASAAATDANAYDFQGNSHIFIYTVLTSACDAAGHAVTISDGDQDVSNDSELYHIIGGNAWIGKASGTSEPVFSGNSFITIDLSKYQDKYGAEDNRSGGRHFEKAVVGGNYTAIEAGGGADRSTFFYGESHITVTGTDKNGQDVSFLGGVNGASRRDNHGVGDTQFKGDTHITLLGGAYRNYVAGGFWFGGSVLSGASVDETHTSTLTGNTYVQLGSADTPGSGEYWRVVGGNVSIAGMSGSGGTITGTTEVTITGGVTFGLKHNVQDDSPMTQVNQETAAAVVGGSYLQDTQGVYTQDGEANVTITGGTFNNTHIVAGDYVYSTLTEKDPEKESSVTLEGGTTLNLGDGAGTVLVNGFVVGGSYITDKGKGGTAIIGTEQKGDDASYDHTVTHVTVNGGVTLNAETDEKGNSLHDGVALVAGSVLIDEEGKSGAASQGGHHIEIYGGTQLDINGGIINGTVVGGSYSAHADGGSNELIIHGNSAVNIAGGEIHGNVYGGHYSANAENPDHLTLGNVTVTMSSGTVDGYIFGGGFRKAHKPVEGGESPVQGALTVDLQSGTLAGGVFAAGDHFNEGAGALHVRTESTRIRLSSKVTLQPGEEDGTAREYVMLSGGYLRSNDGAAGGTSQDYSTVGYSEDGGTWNATAAVLEFTDSGESYAEELKSLPIHLQDFDAVQVDSGNLVLDNTKLLVMHKVSSADDTGNHDSFTKLGSGNLTLGQGLSSRNAQTEAEETFTGRFIVKGGELVLGHDGTNGVQSLEGGLTFWMYDGDGNRIRSAGNKDNAYLRGINGTVFGRGAATGAIEVNFDETTLQQGLTVGVYYLVDGLSIDGLTPENVEDYFAKDTELDSLEGDYLYDFELRGDNNEKLVLRVHRYAPDEWYWEGSGDGVWTQTNSGKLTDDWTKEKVGDGENLTVDTYYFDAGAAQTGDVKIDGSIQAGGIVVSSGEYNFVQKEGTDGGLTVGTITVGTDGATEGEAHLKLSLANKSVENVILEDGGWLELAHAEAIQSSTKLNFNGGTLKYGEVDGQLVLSSDLSGQVAEGGTDAIRIQVGDSAEEQTNAPAAAAETDVPFTVTWTGGASNSGIKQAAGYGLIKTGRGGFVLQTSGVTEFAGTLEAQEGTLELKVGGAVTIPGSDIQPTAADSTVQPRIFAEKGATLILAASGEGSGVTVSRAFSGTGTVVIGEKVDGDSAVYTLAADNSGFAGTVRLAGNGTDSEVKVNTAGALGGGNTTLALAGRAIVAAEGTTEITVKEIKVEDGTVNLVGGYGKDTEKSYTLTTGTVTGGGVLANAQGGFRVELSASDISGFTGVLVAGKQGVGSEGESTWTLTGTLANPEVATSLAGTGTVEIAFGSTTKAATPVVLTGTIGDGTLGNTVNVENAMEGTALVLGGGVSGEKADTKAKNTSTGNLIFNGNEIWLGDEGHAGSWMGGLSKGEDSAGTSRFVLRDGVLGKALTNLGGVTLSVDTAVKAGDGMAWVNAGGTAGSLFKDITVNARGRLRNVAGDITVGKSNTKLTLYFDKTGIGTMKGHEDEYLIGGSGNLTVNEVTPVADEGAPFVLDFSNDGLLDILKTHRKDEVKSYLHLITGGGIQFGKTPEDQQQALDRLLRTGNYTTLLSALGFTLGVDGGDLTLLGSSKDVYLVLGDDPENQGDPHTVTDPGAFNDKKAVLVDENTTLTLDDPDNGTAGTKAFKLKNLVGLEGSTLAVGDEAGKDDITVTFDNSTLLPADEEQANDPWLGELTDSEVYGRLQGLDTEFDGTIVGNGEKVNFEKDGAGTLTVGSESGTGGMDIDGTLTLIEGDVVLRGDATEDGSHLGGLTFSYAKKKGDGLTVQGARLTVDDITVEEGSDAASNNVDITDSGELVYGGKNGGVLENLHLKSSDESGTLSTDGTLTLGSGSDITGLDVRLDAQQSGDEQQSTGGKLELQGDAEMHARAVELGNKGWIELSGSTGKHTVEALSGTAGSTLSGGTGTDLTVTGTGGNFSGTLSGGGKLSVAKDAEFTLENVTTDAPDTASAWGIDVQSGGTFTLDTSEQHGGAGPRFGDVVFAGGSDVTLKFDYNADGGTTAHMNSLTFGDGSALTLESTSESPYTGNPDRIVIGYAANGEEVTADVDITLKGVSFLHFEAEGIHYDAGTYYVGTKQVRKNLFAEALPHKEKNAMAGAELFWSASSPESPALKEALKNPLASDLLRMLAGLTAMKDSGDASGLARALAAGAGASISVLGPALAEDIHRQLMSIRSRATGVMDDMQTDGYDAYPFWHAWITGEGGYRKLDADGFAPGYTLNNWGGSVGADATLSQRTSVGLAITAMYGDLKPEASDSATGDLDTVYLSGYLRHASGAWSHTFALSMGVSDIKLDRTVTYGMGSYRTHGNTDGLSFGVLYEIGYSRFVNKSGSFVLQPIANVELRHAMINGYTETGSDAGLQVDDIEQTVLTFGAGVRVQGLIGQQTFNHDALVEARALVKADVGDRSGTSRHAIIRDTTHAEVESAEVGAVGVETGVGLSIPLGLNAGSIILDGSVEFRSGWTSANASVGYRISF